MRPRRTNQEEEKHMIGTWTELGTVLLAGASGPLLLMAFVFALHLLDGPQHAVREIRNKPCLRNPAYCGCIAHSKVDA